MDGFCRNEKIEQAYGLVNSVYSEEVDSTENPNLRFIGNKERILSSITTYPAYAYGLIKDNSELQKQFLNLICETKDNISIQTSDGRYKLDGGRIKNIRDVQEREKYLKQYQIISHQGLLGKKEGVGIKQEYERYLSQKQLSLIDFLDEKNK